MVQNPEYFHIMKEVARKRSTNMEWLRNVTEGAQKRAKDPEWKRAVTEANRKKAQDPEWRCGQREIALKLLQDPEYLRKQKEGLERRKQNPEWKHNLKAGAQKRAKDPEWIRKNKEVGRNNAQNPDWKRKQTEAIQKREQNPEFLQKRKNMYTTDDWRLKQKEGRVGGFWCGAVIYPAPPQYCEIWGKPFWRRIDKAQNYKSILSGKTKDDNICRDGKTRALSRHHVYYQKKACCEWDEDTQGYHVWINIGSNGKPNWYKYQINGDPNKFVLLTAYEHGLCSHDKLKWIKIFEDLIETKLNGVCYLPKEKSDTS